VNPIFVTLTIPEDLLSEGVVNHHLKSSVVLDAQYV